MTIKQLLGGAIAGALVLLGVSVSVPGAATTSNPPAGVTVPVETVADYIHAVIEADRDSYTRHVVERMQLKGIVVASENWAEKNTLPLPAQFLMESDRLIEKKMTVGIRYRLISLWPINKRHAPVTEFEKSALGLLLTNSKRPQAGFVDIGGRRYYQAVYADLAGTQSCIGCHNAHPDSPKRDFKMNDVMGGIVVSIPVDR